MLDVNSVEYRQAAISINYEIEAVFRKNLDFFKKEDKSLYDLFKNYTPQKLTLRLDPNGYLNLFNINTGVPVYSSNPVEYAEKQVKHHLMKKPVFLLHLTMPDAGRDDYPYTKCLRGLDTEYRKIYSGIPVRRSEVPQLFMFGGGLFLQLEFLLNDRDIKNLSIFEPNHDSFYASMHLIDWSEIYRYFSRDGYSLHFNLIGNDTNNLVKLAHLYAKKGFHHFARIEQYVHYENDELDNLQNNFKSNLQTIIGSKGFFEDERVGLAHTVANLKSSTKLGSINLYKKKRFNATPVFIVGNGPSLDKLESYLFNNKDKAIIVSCGSALSALLKKGIKPDLHIEQERMSITPQWIKESTTRNEREGISVVALNSCHPDVFELFDGQYVGVKPSDLGTDLIMELKLGDVAFSENCLPLVGNNALSTVINLGFNNIYLAGLDCGVIDKDKHHSKDSNYFNKEKNYAEEAEEAFNDYGTYKIKGNLRDFVFTSSLYNYSRVELETLLEKYKPNCFNLSDGAFIKGAAPVNELIPLKKVVYKKKVLERQLSRAFFEKKIDDDEISYLLNEQKELFLSYLPTVKKLFDIKGLTFAEIIKNFDTLELVLLAIEKQSKIVFRLLNGSLKGLAYKVTVAYYSLSTVDFDLFYKKAEVLIDRFFDEVENDIKYDFLKYDQEY